MVRASALQTIYLCMQITQSQLKQIILEEYRQVVSEKKYKQDSPSNPYHDDDGRFSSYDDSRSWSLDSKQREMKSGKNVKPCGRGQRRKCKKPQELKWEGEAPPRSDSTSDYRRDSKRYRNDRMRKSDRFPGYDDFTRLAHGIMEEFDERLNQLDEKKGNKQCFNRNQMMQLRQSIFNQIMGFINTYENVKKNTNPKPSR